MTARQKHSSTETYCEDTIPLDNDDPMFIGVCLDFSALRVTLKLLPSSCPPHFLHTSPQHRNVRLVSEVDIEFAIQNLAGLLKVRLRAHYRHSIHYQISLAAWCLQGRPDVVRHDDGHLA